MNDDNRVESTVESDGSEDSLAESPALLAALERLSRSFAGRGVASMAEAIVAELTATGAVAAAGVWIDQAGQLARRSWVTVNGGHINDRLVDEIVARRTAAPSQQRLGQAFLITVPLLRQSAPSGALALVSPRPLNDGEMTALTLFARQVAAELAVQSNDESAPDAISEFISLVTHELRSPLTALRGNVQLAGMAVRKGDLSRAGDRIEAALKGVDSITALVQNLQDINQLERGRFQLEFGVAELAPTVERAARRAERMTDARAGTIEVATRPALVAQDDVRLEQALFNLFFNALQYSSCAPVQAVLTTDDGEALVTITDRGIGIPRQELVRIFQPYVRGSLANATSAKGLGLGLAVSRATVQRHGGRIDVTSSPGKGSIFTVRLPLLDAA